eukprot:2991691-Rhodomonas_salina.2
MDSEPGPGLRRSRLRTHWQTTTGTRKFRCQWPVRPAAKCRRNPRPSIQVGRRTRIRLAGSHASDHHDDALQVERRLTNDDDVNPTQ